MRCPQDAFGADGQLNDDPNWTMYVLKGHESAEKNMFHVVLPPPPWASLGLPGHIVL